MGFKFFVLCAFTILFTCVEASSELPDDLFILSEEVKRAKMEGIALVALESTVISHGLPFPANLETAKELERIVRAGGAIPATIALIRGKIHIGLNDSLLLKLAQNHGETVKTSRRDIAVVVATSKSGATTVSATSLLAHKAGISVFVTGGIGGVHRGVEETMDISADLTELGRTPVAVVCAGVKSILDIGKTLEYLETEGVPVIGYQTDTFPAFFTPNSGFKVSARLNSAEEVAKAIAANIRLELNNGMVIGVPIAEEEAADGEAIEAATQQALKIAKEQGIRGREITPFILSKVNELTGGQSLKANTALLRHNARVGTEIAVKLQQILHQSVPVASGDAIGRPIVIGGIVMDLIGKPKGELLLKTSNPGTLSPSWGGVGRNIAETLSRLGSVPLFISAIGNDVEGKLLLQEVQELGMDASAILITKKSTAKYSAILDHRGEMIVAISDMEVFDEISPTWVSRFESHFSQAPMIVIDGNIPIQTLQYVLELSSKYKKKVWFEPVSVVKSSKIADPKLLPMVSYLSPNVHELAAILSRLENSAYTPCSSVPECSDQACRLLNHGVEAVVVKMGARGAMVAGTGCKVTAEPALEATIVSVNGAGDSLDGGTIWGLMRGKDWAQSLRLGIAAAKMSLEGDGAVSPLMSPSTLEGLVRNFVHDEL